MKWRCLSESDRSQNAGIFTDKRMFDTDTIGREHPDSFTDGATDFVQQDLAKFRHSASEDYHFGMQNRNDVRGCDTEVLASPDQGFTYAMISRFCRNQHGAG